MKDNEALRAEVLNKLAPHFTGKLQWEVDMPPLVGASPYPYTLVELQERDGIAKLFGKKHVDLLGMNCGEQVFYSGPRGFAILDDRLLGITSQHELDVLSQRIDV